MIPDILRGKIMKEKLFYVYCDESRQDLLVNKNAITPTNRYACIGGIMIEYEYVNKVINDIKAIKSNHSVRNEISWTTVSDSKIHLYSDLIEYFFKNEFLYFRSIIIDSSKVDNETFNNGDHELGYYKFYHQLLLNWLENKYNYRVYTDNKTKANKKRLQSLKLYFNIKMKDDVILSIQDIDSKFSPILQLENIIMGAVGYKMNFKGNGTSLAKNKIVNEIESYLNLDMYTGNVRSIKFNLFKINLRGSNG